MLRTSPGSRTAAHPQHHHQLPPVPLSQMPHVPLPSALRDPQGAGYVTVSLGAFPPLLETFTGQTLAGTMALIKGVLELERGESQGWQILGENWGMRSSSQPDPKRPRPLVY